MQTINKHENVFKKLKGKTAWAKIIMAKFNSHKNKYI